jgi:hypothetical protein
MAKTSSELGAGQQKARSRPYIRRNTRIVCRHDVFGCRVGPFCNEGGKRIRGYTENELYDETRAVGSTDSTHTRRSSLAAKQMLRHGNSWGLEGLPYGRVSIAVLRTALDYFESYSP